MKVYRAMSDLEYYNWKLYGVEGLFKTGNKYKRMTWFATDLGYIGTIIFRGMYNNRPVREAYRRIVEFELKLTDEITVKLKPENGFVNIGVSVRFMDKLKLKETNSWIVSNAKDELKNYIVNGNLEKRAWFVRADYYDRVVPDGKRN